MQDIEITVEISTKDRYFTTLPMCLASIANQTYKPKKILIFDDGEHKDLRQEPIYINLFALYQSKGIEFEVIFGQKKGQVHNHQAAIYLAKTDWIWRCFRGNQKVETINGLKNIRDIEIGELVKTHKGRYKKVIRTYKQDYEPKKELLWIYTKNSVIKCTPDHPFLILKDNKRVWTKASNLNESSILLYPCSDKKDEINFDCFGRGAKYNKLLHYSGKNFKNEYFGKFSVDEDLARFFGLYLAEGCGGHDSIRFTFNNKEKEFIDFIIKVCKEKFNRNPTVHSRWATCVKLNIRSFAKKFTEWFGDDATNKKVPDFVFDWSLKNKLAFLQGYLDGDGWQNQKMYRFGTASKDLFNGIKKLCIESGLDCTDAHETGPKETQSLGVKIKSSGCLSGAISSIGYSKMQDIIQSKIVDNCCIIPINRIENKKMPTVNWKDDQYVYNLEVEEDNSYIVGPCICHNCDDDDFPEPNCLEEMIKSINEEVGAIGPLVLDPKEKIMNSEICSSKIEHIYTHMNIQWSNLKEIKEVDHLNNTFLFRKKAALDAGGYCLDLSPVGHREETLFTYQIKRDGYKVLVNPGAIVWHLRNPSGGIRSYEHSFFWEHDEKVFLQKLRDFGVKIDKLIILNCGLGDHFAFKMILPELKNRYNLTLSVCYPEVFKNDDDLNIISIQDAMKIEKSIDNHSVYLFMIKNNWKGTIVDAFRKMLL